MNRLSPFQPGAAEPNDQKVVDSLLVWVPCFKTAHLRINDQN